MTWRLGRPGEKEAGEVSRDNMGSQPEGGHRAHAWAVGLEVRMASYGVEILAGTADT